MPARTCPSVTLSHHFDQDTKPPAGTLDRDSAPASTWAAELLQGTGRVIQTVIASVVASTLGPHVCLQGYVPSTIHHFDYETSPPADTLDRGRALTRIEPRNYCKLSSQVCSQILLDSTHACTDWPERQTSFRSKHEPGCKYLGPRQTAYKNPAAELLQTAARMHQSVLTSVFASTLGRHVCLQGLARMPHISSTKTRTRLQIPWTATERMQGPGPWNYSRHWKTASKCARKCARKCPWTAPVELHVCLQRPAPSAMTHVGPSVLANTRAPHVCLQRSESPRPNQAACRCLGPRQNACKDRAAKLLQVIGETHQAVLAKDLASTLRPQVYPQGLARTPYIASIKKTSLPTDTLDRDRAQQGPGPQNYCEPLGECIGPCSQMCSQVPVDGTHAHKDLPRRHTSRRSKHEPVNVIWPRHRSTHELSSRPCISPLSPLRRHLEPRRLYVSV